MDSLADPDVALAEALAEFVHVLWVDPAPRTASKRGDQSGIDRISPNLTRLRRAPVVGPGSRLNHRLSRHLARRSLARSIADALNELDATSNAVVLSDPTGHFPLSISGHRLYYMTNDWVSGAAKHGVARGAVRKTIERNCEAADTVAAVSHTLAIRLHLYSKTIDAVRVVPTGCTVPDAMRPTPPDLPTMSPIALVCPLDDGLDYDILDAVAQTGTHIVVTGPVNTADPTTAGRAETFLAHHNVHWVGTRPDASAADYLSGATVGIAPFLVDAFNRARFPAQTLDYLASGLAVVTTDLPATRWLDSEHVSIAESPQQFADMVLEYVASEPTSALSAARRDVAAEHTWTVRATALARLMALPTDASARTDSRGRDGSAKIFR